MSDLQASIPSTPDICVVGGGAVGLWCAVRAAEKGLSVVLAESDRVGQGASGGILGALMPHQPVNIDAKKAFQLEALLSLETEIRALEEATGAETGYRRSGRLQPLRTAEGRQQALMHAAAAAENWPAKTPAGANLRFDVAEHTGSPFPQAAIPFGVVFDSLSAHVEPRSLVDALRQRAEQLGVVIFEQCAVQSIGADGVLRLGGDMRLAPGHVILAAGVAAFALAEPLVGMRLGRGVKGQAALLQPSEPLSPDMPILFDSGIYVIGHQSGLAAVGSTSENDFGTPDETDALLDTVIDAAAKLYPPLASAQVVERWASVRPKAIGRDPIIGPLPDAPRVILCGGGFKITHGIAHRMADAVLACVAGSGSQVPDAFRVERHLEVARQATVRSGMV